MTDVSELLEFLTIAGEQGFLNDNTVISRKTACNKFVDILEPSQKTVEYVRDNLDVIKSRFSNLNKEIRGNTVEEYARRVQLVLNDFESWKTDRAAWERSVSNRQNARATGDGEKKTRTQKPENAKKQSSNNGPEATKQTNSDARVVTFPIRLDFDLSVTLPRDGIKVSELKKLVYFLLPYTKDWEPTDSPRSVFPMLEDA
jgi:hypothetical protein